MPLASGPEPMLTELRRRASIHSAQSAPNKKLPLECAEQKLTSTCRAAGLALPGPNERALLELLEHGKPLLQQIAVGQLVSTNTQLPRRHSAHCCPSEHPLNMVTKVPPVAPRPPAVPERSRVGPPLPFTIRLNTTPAQKNPHILAQAAQQSIIPQPPPPRVQPPIPPPHTRQGIHVTRANKPPPLNTVPYQNSIQNQDFSNKQPQKKPNQTTEALKPCQIHELSKTGRVQELPIPNQQHLTQSALQQNTSNSKMSVRQDSNVSSDSFSQTSSPSYTTKTMETPLLPHYSSSVKTASGEGGGRKMGLTLDSLEANNEANAANNAALTKSISTPASLQTIVRFHNGSNMSLHHRIIRDIRRPSTHYITRGRLRFRFAQVLFNAVALLAIAGGLAAYFKAYPSTVRYVNQSVTPLKAVTQYAPPPNPAPGICLPVIVSFCHSHRVPYNFTMFPNYMGHFTQRDAQSELEVYDAVVDVRCYELAALFLCSVFVPKCGPTGQLVRPCRNLCHETKRRCGFFLEVFGLPLPDYLECNLFPESEDENVCVGHREVMEAMRRAQKPVCISGFECDARRCLPSDWRCDGHVDCQDQSDELNCQQCPKGMVHCGKNKCMSQVHVCDGKSDCPWGQDERNCLRLTDQMGDEAKGQVEVYQPEDKSWQSACTRDWDAATVSSICHFLGYQKANSSLAIFNESVTISSKKRFGSILNQLRPCPEEQLPSVELHCTSYVCGRRRQPQGPAMSRIIGGTVSTPGDWPFLAALLGGPEEVFYCAGVLIADQWVLTASHCVGNLSQSEPTGWTIQLGITRRHAHSYYDQKMKVKRVVPHPAYNLGVTHDNDVALFQLETPVRFHEHLLPVCLPSPGTELSPGTVCTVIGWGKREDKYASEYEPAVNEVKVPVLNRELCNTWLEHRDLNVTEGMICAGYAEGGKDACQGDSGGPLLCRDELKDRWFVGGIVSWGIKCAHPRLPGVYAYVPRYVPWIRQQMELYTKDN